MAFQAVENRDIKFYVAIFNGFYHSYNFPIVGTMGYKYIAVFNG